MFKLLLNKHMKKRLFGLFSIIFALVLLVSCGKTTLEVNFDLNGGTSARTIEMQKIKEGSLVTKPTDPTRAGYTFLHWALEDEEWVFATDKVTKNMTLVATWDLNEYVVSFDTLGGAPIPEAQTVNHGQKAVEPEVSPTLEGNEFLGWYLGEELFDFDTAITEAITLKAKWSLIFTVTFYKNDDTSDSFTQAVLNGNIAKTPTNPGRQGFVFSGWYFTDEGDDVLWDFDTLITNDIVLHAKWITIKEHVSMDFDAIDLNIIDGKINLPERGPVNNIRLNWKSNTPTVVTNSGVVNQPLNKEGDAVVVLTATTTFAGETFTKDFTITIPAKTLSVVTSEIDLDFTNLTNEYEVLDNNITAYFIDNGNLPYLDVESFLMLLDGLIYADELSFNKNDYLLEISYEVTDEEETETFLYEAVIDFYEKTLYVEYMSFFTNYIKSTATDYSEGINYVDYYFEDGNPVIFDFGNYHVEMIVYEVGDEVYYLMPYNFLSMIFTSETYYNFYYNGDGFYGYYSIPYLNDKDDEFSTFSTIKTSSLNNTFIPKDVALSAFHQTAFIFDYYFGLRNKETYQIQESFYEKLTPNIDNYLINTNSFNTTLRSFIFKTLDELHSSYHFPGYYNRVSLDYPLFITDLGPKVVNWYENGLWEVQDSIDYWHNNNREGFKFLDSNKETAVIYLDDFLTASVDEEKTSETDSDAFMEEMLTNIFNENPNVKNIGIDLSYNTGGNIGALLRVLGYITEKPIEMSYIDPLTNEKSTYFIELDQDAYENVNWFFITSPVTFSAANLMTAIVKNQNLGLIIGTTSGGGAASITPFVLAEGSMISISSNSLFAIRTLNSNNTYTYKDIEDGIEPDLLLEPINTQNKQMILDLVNSYYN